MRQGDTTASVLFLFLVSAFVGSLEAIWKENNHEMIDLKRQTGEEFGSGRCLIKGHKPCEHVSHKKTKQTDATVSVLG